MLIGGVFARDPGILIGDGNAGAGDYGSGSVLNGALKPTADTLPEDERGRLQLRAALREPIHIAVR